MNVRIVPQLVPISAGADEALRHCQVVKGGHGPARCMAGGNYSQEQS